MKFKLRTLFLVVTAICISMFAMKRTYRQFVPVGVKFMPYVAASVDAGTITSPGGTVYRIRYNDAGAMHSGNHWTWVVDYHFLTGYSVVDAGYLTLEQANDFSNLEIDWDGQLPMAPWCDGRYK